LADYDLQSKKEFIYIKICPIANNNKSTRHSKKEIT